MSHSIPNPSALKTCADCLETKPLSDFRYTLGYYRSVCRVCYNANRRKERANDPDYLPAVREYKRAWREANPERAHAIDAARYARDAEKRQESARKARAKNPLRERAHTVVRLAVDRGALPPAWAMVCEVCQEAQATDWHHHSYESGYQMDVIAVCSVCHGKEHRAQ